MIEERSCYNCAIDLICEECNEGNSKWQPIAQEKPMENKVIFDSEEQFVNFWKDLTGCDCLPGTREKIKQKGYIRKSELVELVEEAEWIYENYQSAKYCLTTSEALEKNYQALQALKKDHPEFGGKK
jgi:hypothetical protein